MAEAKSFDTAEIMNMIPHRYPFLLIDRVENLHEGESAVGIKAVTVNEPFFPGHFPGHPVMPGVLIIEAMAQTAAIVVVDSLGEETEGKLVYFMSVDKARFRKPVLPGDTLNIEVQKIQSRGKIWKFEGKALVNGNVAAEADFMAMIRDA
ncbi:MAG: 3-hydroxyacyl-ACP dehydratase FabZ [Rhodospirillales bacterium]|nr:3-hydroxyacyl-ACP dehydratase FabZ [Rhodospirillales bacterium]